jgi:carbonic anhydrase
LDEILEANAEYMKTPEAGRFSTSLTPGTRALIACMDPRSRIEALGADRPDSEGRVVRLTLNAGGKLDFRSLFPYLFLANLKEFAFMTHTDCGLTKMYKDPDMVVERMRERLGEEQFVQARAIIGEPFKERLVNWLGGFPDPYEEVRQRVETFKNHPMVPKDVIAHGLLQDIFTGKVEVVVNGYE